MENSRYYLALLVACLGLSPLAGCCSSDPCACCVPETGGRPFRQVYLGTGVGCYGYHSTCWSPWPAECQTCPAPNSGPADADAGPEAVPGSPSEPMPPSVPSDPPAAPPKEPAKPAEPSSEPNRPDPDSAPTPLPGKPPRALETKPPTASSSFPRVTPQNFERAFAEDVSAAPILPKPAQLKYMPPPVVIERPQ